MASDTAQLEPIEHAATEHGKDGLPIAGFEVVASAKKVESDGDPYAFRTVLEPPKAEPAAPAKNPKAALGATLLLAAAAIAGLAVLVFAGAKVMTPKPPVPYIDLGEQRFDPAGLGGRLIAQWDNGPGYRLSIDPIDVQHVALFAAVAGDPPMPISITIRLLDSSGEIACQKQIVLPQGNGEESAMAPETTASGDTVQNLAGEDGKIAEIDVTGTLPCPQKAYSRLVAWNFLTNFPTLTAQQDWLRHEQAIVAGKKPHLAANAIYAQAQRLPGPIEGDDAIVGDNPSRGTVMTSVGRVFLVGAGWHNRGTEWQVFPASFHFRCEKNGFCVLTRANSRTALLARLLK